MNAGEAFATGVVIGALWKADATSQQQDGARAFHTVEPIIDNEGNYENQIRVQLNNMDGTPNEKSYILTVEEEL